MAPVCIFGRLTVTSCVSPCVFRWKEKETKNVAGGDASQAQGMAEGVPQQGP